MTAIRQAQAAAAAADARLHRLNGEVEVARKAAQAAHLELAEAKLRADDGLPRVVVVDDGGWTATSTEVEYVFVRRSKTSVWLRLPGREKEERFIRDSWGKRVWRRLEDSPRRTWFPNEALVAIGRGDP